MWIILLTAKPNLAMEATRTETQHNGIVPGRDYYYFNVYGTRSKRMGMIIMWLKSIAIKSDDYETYWELLNLIELLQSS